MKKILIVIGSFIGIIVVGAIIMSLSLSKNMSTIRAIEINDINPSILSNGSYRGSYYFEDQIGAEVDVTIQDGKITNIQFIEHIAGKGTIAESITDDIIKQQSLNVDAVSGATTSSHVIKLAIMDALEE